MNGGAIAGICIAVLIVLIILIILLRWINQGPKYRKTNRIDGKICLITGCNTGIGKVTALELAKRGGTIYMACRNMQKAQQAQAEILAQCGHKNVYCRQLDLNSLDSVRQFAEAFKKDETKLDILINNAGLYDDKQKLTKDGFELHIGVNHLAHFLLTNLLLDMLKKAAPSRIIVLSSVAHKYVNFDKKDTNLESMKSKSAVTNYGLSKLANVLFAKELSKRLEGTGVVVNSLHPGVVQSEFTRNVKCIGAALHFFGWPFAKSVESGARTTIYLALDPDLEKVTGKYFSNSKIVSTSRSGNDDSMAKWMWEQSENLINNV